MQKVKVIEGQTILDLAIEKYGHLGGVFIILEDNPQYSITSVPVPGVDMNFRTEIQDPNQDAEYVRKYYSNRNYKVSSGHPSDDTIIDSDLYVDEDYWDDDYTD